MFMIVWDLHNTIRRFLEVGINWGGIAQDVE